jgi:hypothetical protein
MAKGEIEEMSTEKCIICGKEFEFAHYRVYNSSQPFSVFYNNPFSDLPVCNNNCTQQFNKYLTELSKEVCSGADGFIIDPTPENIAKVLNMISSKQCSSSKDDRYLRHEGCIIQNKLDGANKPIWIKAKEKVIDPYKAHEEKVNNDPGFFHWKIHEERCYLCGEKGCNQVSGFGENQEKKYAHAQCYNVVTHICEMMKIDNRERVEARFHEFIDSFRAHSRKDKIVPRVLGFGDLSSNPWNRE